MATSPVKVWTRLLGSSGEDKSTALTTGPDGSIYISGSTTGLLDGQANISGNDAFLTKFSADGTKAWTRLLGTSGEKIEPSSHAYSLTTGLDGFIYVSGSTSGSLDGQTNSGGQDAFLIKLNANGIKAWARLLGTSGEDHATALTTGLDGFIYITGYTSGSLDGQTYSGGKDAFLTKYSADGAKVWTRLLGSADDNYAYALTTGLDGSIYISGLTGGSLDGQASNGNFDAFLTKYSADGTKAWTRLLGSSNYDEGYGLTTGLDGSIFVSGYTRGSLDGQINSGGDDAFLTKYSSDGTKVWTKLLGQSGNDYATSLTTGLDGSIYVSGTTSGTFDGQKFSGGLDAFLTKYSTDGTKVWSTLLGQSGNDWSLALTTGLDGSIYVSGTSDGSLDGQTYSGNYDAFLVKYQDWTFGTAGNDWIDGGLGDDRIDGGLGDDRIDGRSGNDTLIGGEGDDGFIDNEGVDYFDGGPGNNIISFNGGSQGVIVNFQTGVITNDGWGNKETLVNVSSGHGSENDDVIIMNNVGGYFFGEAGNDLLVSGSSGGWLNGGPGNDTIQSGSYNLATECNYSANQSYKLISPHGVVVDLTAGIAIDNWGFTDTLIWISNVSGSTFDDIISGDGSINFLRGEAGNDTLSGGGGHDQLVGGSGVDSALYSGKSANYTVIRTGQGTYTVTDNVGTDGADTLSDIEKLVFSDLTQTLYSLTIAASADSVNEGAFISFSITTIGFDVGASLTYTLTGVSVTDVVGASLTGSTTLGADGKANFKVYLLSDNLTEGAETLSAIVQGQAALVTVNDTSKALPSYSIAANSSSVNEGAFATFTLSTKDVAAGTSIAYAIAGVSATDITDGSLNGTAVVNANGIATIQIAVAADLTTEGSETLTVTTQGVTASVLVSDTSITTVLIALPNTIIYSTPYGYGQYYLPTLGADKVTGTFFLDVVKESSTLANNQLTKLSDGNWQVQNKLSPINTDILVNVERVEFNDLSVALDVSGSAGQVAKILGSVFGTGFLTNTVYAGIGLAYLDDGMSYKDLCNLAASAAGLSSPEVLVATLLKNSTGTEPSLIAKSSYLQSIANGASFADIVLQISDSIANTQNIKLAEISNTGLPYTPYILPPTFSIAAASTSVNEGLNAVFNLTTTKVAIGTEISYTLSGISTGDLASGSLTGKVAVGANGLSTITIPIASDSLTEGPETLTLTTQGVSASTVINDTSKASVIPTYSLTAATNVVNEGALAQVYVSTTNVAAGTSLQFGISGVGITQADVIEGLSRFVTVDSTGKAVININTVADQLTEGQETMYIILGASTTSFIINDTSITLVGVFDGGGDGGGGGGGGGD